MELVFAMSNLLLISRHTILSCAFAQIRQCKQPQKLHGLSNVNDYFNSFNSNDDSNIQPNNDKPGQGSSYASVNDYFNSFNFEVLLVIELINGMVMTTLD